MSTVVGLAHCASVLGEVRHRTVAETKEDALAATSAAVRGGRKTVLLFRNGEREQMAIDLALVARLEEIPLDMVELASGREVIQYRGQIVPLIRVADVFGTARAQTADSKVGSLQVVVYTDHGRSVGLVIDQILDIVEVAFTIQPQTQRNGVLGSAVIQQRTTAVLDIPALVAASQSREIGMAAPA